ncbi:MAG: GNAT family N-acetyltransferase [Candidatus Peregrinibacteria bacterium]
MEDESLSIDALCIPDIAELSDLILDDSPDYRAHFIPFPFDRAALLSRMTSAQKDRYWVIRVRGRIGCFFMLRGFDEGFERPSFGVYVGEHFAGSGLAGLALHYVLSWCHLHSVASVMLKVHPENSAARHIYERAGFTFEGVCPQTKHHILMKVLHS